MTVLIDNLGLNRVPPRHGQPVDPYVREAILADRPLAWTEPILFELTAGARNQRRATELRALLLRGPTLTVDGLRDWEVAANLCRSARSRGSPSVPASTA